MPPMSILLQQTAIFLALSAIAANRPEDVAGRWEGSIRIPECEFNLIVDLSQNEAQNWTGSIIIPGLGVKGAPLTDLAVNDAGISFAIKGVLASKQTGPAKFKGHLLGAGKLTGNFLQAGNSAPFELKKNGPAQVELPPKSTAISKEFEGEWKGDYEMDGYPRHVTLTLSNQDSGAAKAELVVVGKRTTNAPIDLVTDENGFLTIASHEIGITYEGRLGKGADAINGTFTLGPFERPLVLRKSQ